MPFIKNAVAHQFEDFGLRPDEVALLWRMEEQHFWHSARNRWIEHAIRVAGVKPPATILDVGCGSGAVAQHLHTSRYRVTGIDTAEWLIKKAYERCPEATFILGEVEYLQAEPYDVIGLFDVLEHLFDPLHFLRKCLRLSHRATLVVATVPAQSALQTVIDDLSGHKKRYETGELAALLNASGLVDIEERGIFRAILPLQKLARRRFAASNGALTDAQRHALWEANFRVPPAPINELLSIVCTIERLMGFRMARGHKGASLIATGRVASTLDG